MFENEEWRPVAEPILDHYIISNYGRVKREAVPEKALKQSVSDKGFPIVTLYGKDSRTRYLRQINILVAKAFLPPPLYTNETAIWHIDGDLTNCRTDNLKWDTRARVLEWNQMHRDPTPQFKTPRVRNNRIGKTYMNAFDCAMQEGRLESEIVWRVERQARHWEDPAAKYRYVFSSDAEREELEDEVMERNGL